MAITRDQPDRIVNAAIAAGTLRVPLAGGRHTERVCCNLLSRARKIKNRVSLGPALLACRADVVES